MKSFLRAVLIIALMLVCALTLVTVFAGDDGSLPFRYEGFG